MRRKDSLFKKNVSGITFALLLIGSFLFAFEISLIKSLEEGEVLFFDDFDDGVDDGWTVQSGTWEVVSEEYYCDDPVGGDGRVTTVNDLILDDLKMTAHLRVGTREAGFSQGLVFRYSDLFHYYYVWISEEYDDLCICKITPEDHWHGSGNNTGKWTIPISPGINYTLELVASGSDFTAYLNGEAELTWSDGNYTSGLVGLRVQGSDCYFDNFTVYSIPKTIYVDDDNTAGPWNGTTDHPYQNITSGLTHAYVGDTIFVRNGTYYENVVVNKSVSLIGDDLNPRISGLGTPYTNIVSVFSNNVSIQRFDIRGADHAYGLCLTNANNCALIGNSFISNTWYGLKLHDSHHNLICNNSFRHNGHCVLFDNSDYNVFEGNLLRNNLQNGMNILVSCNNTFANNEISNNGFVGIKLTGQYEVLPLGRNLFANNTILNNLGGMVITSCGENVFINNNFTDNQYALEVDGSTLVHFIQYMKTSNLINGEPIKYLISEHNRTIENAGYVAIVNSSEVTVRDLELNHGYNALMLAYSSNCTIKNVNTTNCAIGFYIYSSINNILKGNKLFQNNRGISIHSGQNNLIKRNNVINNKEGVFLLSNKNKFYHNNFMDNEQNINPYMRSTSYWDNGCEGNYWSDYNGTDLDGDGIGDTPHTIDQNNTDKYPLMNRYWNPCDIDHNLKVNIRDVGISAKAYDTEPGDERWNPHADITGPIPLEPDDKVDMRDIGLIARNFGETYP